MNLNPSKKRNFEPDLFSPYNPIRKVRLLDGREKPSFPSIYPQNDSNSSSTVFQTQTHRPMYKVHHKCKENTADHGKTLQFKAKPMPNFSQPFVPQHFKAPATSFQEFNLSCYSKEAKKSYSRCETPESLQFSSFWSDKKVSPSPQKSGFKARPMPNFSQPFFPILAKSAISPFGQRENFGENQEKKFENLGKKSENQGRMEMDGEGMDLD